MDKNYNIQLSDVGFGPGLIHKIDREQSAANRGYETTVCGISYACGTITYDEVNCPECCDHNWIDYAKISYPGLKVCTKCDKMKEL